MKKILGWTVKFGGEFGNGARSFRMGFQRLFGGAGGGGASLNHCRFSIAENYEHFIF